MYLDRKLVPCCGGAWMGAGEYFTLYSTHIKIKTNEALRTEKPCDLKIVG